MLGQSASFPPLPRDTAGAVETAFGKGNIYLIIGDQVEHLLAGVDLAGLAATMDKPAATLAMLSLVTAFQYAENLPDRRAAEAVRIRMDWKYALHLPLGGPGFDQSALCAFRTRLLLDPAARQALQQILDALAEIGLLRLVSDQRVEATDVLTAVCLMTRLERLADAMRITLETLATRQPEWLRAVILPYWYERYSQIPSASQLPRSPKGQADLALAIGKDARYLIEKIECSNAALALLPETRSLMNEWQQQFNPHAGETEWRSPTCDGCNASISSSSDAALPV